jgi:hypothetical protein
MCKEETRRVTAASWETHGTKGVNGTNLCHDRFCSVSTYLEAGVVFNLIG